MEDKENNENAMPNEQAPQSHQNQRHSLSRYHHHENEENFQSGNNQEINDHPDNHIVFDPMDDDDLAATRNEESDDEENGEGPASPIRYSPVRQSPMRRMTGLSVATATMSLNDDDEINNKKKKRTSKLMDHQIPSFVELEPDEYHHGVRRSSEPILHARDVLEDPEDFNIVFESILAVFQAGHNHEEDDEVSVILFFWIIFF